jgi:large subunit ribosomal protein L10
MSKAVKDLITKEYGDRYSGFESACVVSVIGLDANSNNLFRDELHKKDVQVNVVKNSLARRALADHALAPLVNDLEGPCALVVGGDSVIDVAKMLVKLKKTFPKVELKQAIIEGDPDLLTVEKLAEMKGKDELLGDIAMLVSSPGRSIAGCLQSPAGKIAGCLKAIADEEGEAA